MTRYEMEEWLKTPQAPPEPPPEPEDSRRAALVKLVFILFLAPFGLSLLLTAGEPNWLLTALGIYAVLAFFGIIRLASQGAKIGRKR